MRPLVVLLLLGLAYPTLTCAQDLTGSYVYQSPQGPVRLELRQTDTQVTGTLTGADGSVNQLDGTFDGQKATGTIAVATGNGWFAAGFLGEGLTLLVADIDPATGQPNLDDGWRLDFTRTPAGSRPAPGAGVRDGANQGAPESRAAPQPSASSPQVQEWLQHLRGKKVTYLDSYSSSDASGYGGYSNRWEAYLCSDGSFHFQSSSSVSVDAGAYGMSSGQNSFRGTWRIVEQGGQVLLQYQRSELAGTEQGEWAALTYRDGATYFDDSRVYVTEDNAVCP